MEDNEYRAPAAAAAKPNHAVQLQTGAAPPRPSLSLSPSMASLPKFELREALGEPGSCVMLAVPGALRSLAFNEASLP